jgi:hypothetical protein
MDGPEESDMQKRLAVILTTALIWSSVSIAGASTIQIDNVRFDMKINADNQQLRLQGAALLRVMMFVKAYAGALYLPEFAPPEKALDPIAKHLVLEYYHPIASEDFAKATRTKILENVDAVEAERLNSRIEDLAALYRDVQPGDRYGLTYVPGEGTRLSLNDEVLGSIPGDDFARAVFSIWLGANPIDNAFKDRLLGDS